MIDFFLRWLSVSLSGTLVALLVMGLCALFGKRLSKAWRYYVWLIVLLRMVVPFAPQGHNLFDVLLAQHVPAAATQPVTQGSPASGPLYAAGMLEDGDKADMPAPLPGDSEPIPQTQDVPPATQGVSFATILEELWQHAWVAWLGIVLLLLVRMVTSYRAFTRFIRAGWKPVDDPKTLDLLDETAKHYGIRKTLPLYYNPLATSPMLVGMIKPVIVLPTLATRKEELRHVLAHELIHYKRKDIWYKWFVQIVCCLHWFNPVIYLVRRDVGMACELSCDERVLMHMGSEDHRGYGDTLLAVIQASGQYSDKVASVTMSEEGKMMRKRLQSIAKPHKRSWMTVACSAGLSLLLLAGAAFAGAYTGMPAVAEAPVPDVSGAAVADPTPEPTDGPTIGQRLDDFLSNVDEWTDAVGEQAVEWKDKVVEQAEEWGKSWKYLDTMDWFTMDDSDANMFSSYSSGDRQVVHQGFYLDGYILHLKYDTDMKGQEGEQSVLEAPSVLIPAGLSAYGDDSAFVQTLKKAVDTFIQDNQNREIRVISGHLRLVSVDGPYTETPDELLEKFYTEDDMGRFTAVLRSGEVSAQQRDAILRKAVQDGEVGYLAITAGAGIDTAVADELLETAYENDDVATFYILLSYASPEAKQRMQDKAVADNNRAFFSGFAEDISPEAIDELLNSMDGEQLDAGMISLLAGRMTAEQGERVARTAYEQGDVGVFSIVWSHLDEASCKAFLDEVIAGMGTDLDAGFVSIIASELSEEQALQLATAAYEEDDVGVFSIVMSQLSAADIEAFHERAHQDDKLSFYAITGK